MKNIFFVLSIFSILVANPSFVRAQPYVNFKPLKQAVVKITAYDDNQETIGEGAGVIVGRQDSRVFILTAYHVVKTSTNLGVRFFQKKKYFNGQIHKNYSENLDIAVVSVNLESNELYNSFPELTKGNLLELAEFDSVTSIGHPFGSEWQPTLNHILNSAYEDYQLAITKTAIGRGNSGGPLFNNQNHLIGLITEIDPIRALAVKIDTALVLLKSWGTPLNLLKFHVKNFPSSLTAKFVGKWYIKLEIPYGIKVKDIFYKIEEDEDYTSTGHYHNIDPRTGLPQPSTGFLVRNLKLGRNTIFFKYVNVRGQEKGPFENIFDAKDQIVKSVKNKLGKSPDWINLKYSEGHLSVSFFHLLSNKHAINEIRYSVDDETLTNKVSFKPWMGSGFPKSFGDDEISVELPYSTKFVCVKVFYIDRSESKIKKFENTLFYSRAKTPLHLAIKKGEKVEVERLLKAGADLNVSDIDGGTLLHDVAMNNQPEIAQLLINFGGQVNALIEDNSESRDSRTAGMTPLHLAVEHDAIDVIKILLDNAADVNLTDRSKKTALQLAISKGQYNIAKFFFDAGIESQILNSMLHRAIKEGRLEAVRVLLDGGAQLNGRTEIYQKTPLHIAAKEGKLDFVRLLLRNVHEIT